MGSGSALGPELGGDLGAVVAAHQRRWPEVGQSRRGRRGKPGETLMRRVIFARFGTTRPSGGLLGRAEVPKSRDFGEGGSTRPSDGLLGRAVVTSDFEK